MMNDGGLFEKRILCVGAGGLGSVALYLLAASGIGTIGIADGDAVEASNLDRQILFNRRIIGCNKAEAAVKRLQSLHPHVKYSAYPVYLSENNAEELVKAYDLVLAAVDSLSDRLLLNRICAQASVPLISGGVDGKSGMVQFVRPGSSACLSCLYDSIPVEQKRPVSEPSVVSVISAWMAQIAIEYMSSGRDMLEGKLLMYDAEHFELSKLSISRRDVCPVCGQHCEN